MTDSQYARAMEIAEDNNLVIRPDRFAKFLVEWSKLRGKDWTKDAGYAGEWAERFRKGNEYIHASGDAIVALVHVDGADEAVKRFTKQLASYNNDVPLKEIERDVKERMTISFEYVNQPVPQEFKGYKTQVRKNTTKSKNDCICQSAKRMIGNIPNFDKNLKKLVKF